MNGGERDPAGYVSLLYILAWHGEDEHLNGVRLPPVPLADFARAQGHVQADALARLSLEVALAARRPDLIRAVLAEIDDALDGGTTDVGRGFFLVVSMHVLPHDPTLCPPPGFALAAEETGIRTRATNEGWAPQQLASALAHLAMQAGKMHLPADGLRLITEAEEADNDWRDSQVRAVLFATSQLRYQVATEQWQQGRRKEALENFAMAAHWFAALGFDQQALHCLDVVQAYLYAEGDSELAQAALPPLGAAANVVVPALGEKTDRVLYDLAVALARELDQDCYASHTVQQIGKAYRFALACRSPGPLEAFPGEEQLLKDIADLERHLPKDTPHSPLNEEFVLGSYISQSEAERGSDARQVFRNSQRFYNRKLNTHLTRTRSRFGEHIYQALAETVELLPERTVLICQQYGEIDKGILALHLSAMTSKRVECTWVSGNLPSGDMYSGKDDEDGSAFLMRASGFQVMEIRAAVREDPLFRDVSRPGAQVLDEALVNMLGPLANRFTQWQADGFEHLCFWPHGPLHFLPFHLLHDAGRPLADHWTVSVIPSLRSLMPAPNQRPDGPVVAFGSPDGGGRFGLPREDVLAFQAEQIARATGGVAYVGSAATRDALLAALPRARYAHIGAHGSHNVAAPAFQCLYLNGSDDGRVYAHDLIHLDLRGLEVVTLAACESALGRFDYGDNLQGLPAALLLAGARTVIGCLWPVHPDPATVFFTHLYEALTSGDSSLEAFRKAQLVTRASHPQYRHWGAFCHIGAWR
jgi:hypothetical protein